MSYVFEETGIIGRSGKWYGCKSTEHIKTIEKHNDDAPFVLVQTNYVIFDAYYTVEKVIPTKAQFETLMDWCSFFGETFEDVTDCWNLPWRDYV